MTIRSRIPRMLIVLACICGARAVAASESDVPALTINGYGTLGVVHSSDDKADYFGDLFRPNGAGYTRSWSADVDSRIGLQATADIWSNLSAVVQVVAEQRYDNSYQPSIEWANLKYRFSPSFSVRVGRIVQPTFLFSDSSKVAYTYPWVRPPKEVYNLVVATHNDGIDASYNTQIGEVVVSFSAVYGDLSIRLPDRLQGMKTEAEDTFAAKLTLEYGPATLRFSHFQSHLTSESIVELFDLFRQFGPEGVDIINRFSVDGNRMEFAGFGFSYDPSDWFVIGEWGSVDHHNVLGKSIAWYLSAGFRYGNLTPFVSLARLNFTDITSDAGLPPSSVPPHLQGLANVLNASLNGILSLAEAQETVAIGLRWDFMRNVALKLQYEHIDRDDGSSGTFGNLQPGFEPGGQAGLFSASINFVF